MTMNDTRGLWRGKRVDNCGWVCGVPLQHCDGDWQLISGKVGAMIIDTIIPDTLGECTGLRDKNGKLIFEGDIVAAYYNPKEKTAIGTICCGKFMDTDSLDNYGYLGWYIEVQGHCISILQPESDGISIEVIGNIHDNPELLKGDTNGQD